MKNQYVSRVLFLLLSLFLALHVPASAQQELPWDPDPECNSIVTTGIVGVTCGALTTLPPGSRYTFGLINLNGALPASGRVDVTGQQDCYHHPAWDVDSIGNVFGITMDDSGNIYVAASSNYSSDFFFTGSVIRYGEIGGGAEDLNAAGTVYKIDGQSGQPSAWAVLPQQAFNFTNVTCEGFTNVNRFTGPGLGNLVFHPQTGQIYVSNFEDGRIYRLDSNGDILDSYDPMNYDDGTPGTPILMELTYGLAVSPDGTQLFFGNVSDSQQPGVNVTGIFSVDLQPDGSFVGTLDNTNLPAGATWNNYVGSEVTHYFLPMGDAFSSVSAISDLEFTPSGNLLVGNRIGCSNTIHTSYNHGGRTFVIGESSGIYDQLLGEIYTSNGFIDDQNAYGGVSAFDNPNGGVEYVVSSADMITEEGPHGICTQPEGIYGFPFAPASPAGIISYVPGFPSDEKGMGGDVFVFKSCSVLSCPTAIMATDHEVCSDEIFDLEYSLSGGDPDEALVIWMDMQGNPVDPEGLTLTHDGCAAAAFDFIVTALCQSDSMIMLTDTATILVYPADLSPFVTVVEEPCFVDVQIDPDCADLLTVIGDIPVINPGDVGTVTVQVVHNELTCDTLDIELSYNCACSIDSLSATPQDCVDGSFMTVLDFTFANTTDQFEVTDGDGNSWGVFNYTELPVMVGPFLGDGVTAYELMVTDTELSDCSASVSVGPVNCQVNCNAGIEADICAGETLFLFENGGDAETWSWSSDGAAVIDDVNAQNPTATEVVNGEMFSVVITTTSGLTETCSVSATVFEQPVCNAGNGGPICAGEPLGLFEDGGSAVAWQWSSDGVAVFDDASVQNPTATGVTDGETFTVEITDANGCVSICSTVAAVNGTPVCNAGNGGPICAGEPLILFEDGGSAVAWQWSSDGVAVFDDASVQNPTATGVTDGETFTVEITDANGCVSTCTTVATVNITPVCNAGNGGPICAGEPLGLFEDGGAAVSWSWSTNGSATFDDASLQSPTATGVVDGEIFTVEITDANGCVSTCTTVATVNITPVCNAGNAGPICAGEPLGLFEDGGAAVSWSWSTNGSAAFDDASLQSPTATGVDDGEIFTVEITDANGCVSTCTTVAAVSDSPVVTAFNNGPVCDGDMLILEAEVSGGTGPFTYEWSHSNGFTSVNATVYRPGVTMDDAGVYELTVTDANGCVSMSSTEVEVNENYTDPGMITGSEYFCGPGFDPGPITEVTPPSGAAGPPDFFWMMLEAGSGNWVIIPGADGPSYDPGPIYVTTQYMRCVRVEGCISAIESNIVNKIVGEEAIVDPTGPTAVCVGETAVYSVTPQAGATYSWNFGVGATPQFASTPTVEVSWNSYGVRQIKVQVSTATCTANNFLPVFVTSTPAFCNTGPVTAPQPIMQVFPNPFRERVEIRLSEPASHSGFLRLSDIQGRVLREIPVRPNAEYFDLDLAELPAGMYFLMIRIGETIVDHERIVKQ